MLTRHKPLNTLRSRQNCRLFADDIFKCIFLNENAWISLKISLKFVLQVRINNIPALVKTMAWCRPGDKALSEPMMVSWLAHINVTRPQRVNSLAPVDVVVIWQIYVFLKLILRIDISSTSNRNWFQVNIIGRVGGKSTLVQVRAWCSQAVSHYMGHLGALRWRHNESNGVSNHQPQGCLYNRLFSGRSKETSKLRVTGLCEGNSPVTGEFQHKWPVMPKMFPFDDGESMS